MAAVTDRYCFVEIISALCSVRNGIEVLALESRGSCISIPQGLGLPISRCFYRAPA
jgi:hypothetical protein